jgi:hypothetical protein
MIFFYLKFIHKKSLKNWPLKIDLPHIKIGFYESPLNSHNKSVPIINLPVISINQLNISQLINYQLIITI